MRGRKPASGLAAVCIAQPLAVTLFLLIAPIAPGETRHLIPALPPLVVLGVMGIAAIVRRAAPLAARETHQRLMACAAALLVLTFLLQAAAQPQVMPASPLRPIEEFVREHGYRALLVPADAEGPMIAGMLQMDRDPFGRFLVRPSKYLSSMNWVGNVYHPLYRDKDEVEAALERLPLDVVIVRMDPPPDAVAHERLLRDAMIAFPGRWRLAGSFDEPGARYAAYEPAGSRAAAPGALETALAQMLAPAVPAIH